MKKSRLSSLSVFFPCYNEEHNVQPLITQLQRFLPQVAQKYEIIVVDDGSCDHTAQVAKKIAAKDKRVRVVTHSHNQGYGASLRSGFQAARYDWIFFTDGDQQFDVTQLADFIPYTQEFNVIIGYRTRRAEGALRAVNARLFKFYIDALFRLGVKDIDCAFKLMKKDVIQSIKLHSTGAFTSAEFLYRLKKKNERFKQLPVDHYPRQFGKPTGNHPKVVLKAGWEALKVYLDSKFSRAL